MEPESPAEPLETPADRQSFVMRVAARLGAFNDWYMHRLPGGPGRMRLRQVVNLHEGSVGPLVLALMLLGSDYSLAAWLYLALHGSYGLFWVAKDVAFGDPNWRAPCSVGSAVAVLFFPLGLYCLAPLIVFTDRGTMNPGGWGTNETLPLPVAFAAVLC
ncbi:MAG: hypothetical protein JRJ84_25430, partial [Deltaproteobacteria bacterium]|nr:hypothetical protein [Deltaproteobacteria bacterium]